MKIVGFAGGSHPATAAVRSSIRRRSWATLCGVDADEMRRLLAQGVSRSANNDLLHHLAVLAASRPLMAGEMDVRALTLQGTVETHGAGLAGYAVSLYASTIADRHSDWMRLGTDISDQSGHFRIA